MYAIVDIAGQQFKVNADLIVHVNRLEAEKGSDISLDKILLTSNNGKIAVGAPYVSGATVSATVIDHFKGDKVIIFKKKRRKGFKKKNGFRASLTKIKVNSLNF